MHARAFLGTAIHAPARGKVEALPDCLIEVDDAGQIAAIHAGEAPVLAARYRKAGRLTALAPHQYLLPGLVDLHVHAPQWPQLGKALDVPLEDWLQRHTFPLEARYADLEFAREVYQSLVASLLANGTTTAVYYATIHLPATEALADICLSLGQRALIGRVAMDNPDECPPYYRDASAEAAEADTRAFIGYVRAMTGNEGGLVHPVVTPRFIPSCTDDLLRRLGRVAAETGCHVQTHCSESDWQHAFVLSRYGVTDTEALRSFGLLTRRTVLGHANFINEADMATIGAAGAGIAHCPLSNVYFSDAVFPLREALDRGLNVGLGTDISGGASPSIFENARQAVIASRNLENGVDPRLPRDQRRRPGARIGAAEAFWLATAGGGVALDMPIGLFQPGYQFDAIMLDAAAPGSNLRIEPADSAEDVVQKIVYNAGRPNVRAVWVAGREVHGPG
jgi:guanine deaminase